MLGMKVENHGDDEKRTVKLSMPAYVNELLERTKMSDCNSVKTPAEAGLKLSREDPPAKSN